ncbi:granulin a isoform X8 [Electrophorus electricus]|uniref:granulin a isoform X8 n=1 Tax=Electrophorus electricus TaxID=8005 RepID=UPI0015CFDD2D|nr:granulin a isoform X8 [Electrophorus electricus]
MLRLVLGLVLLTLVTGSKCPNEDLCGEQQTCCQIPSGEYTCCPFYQGECCEDHLHCCPEGMLCQMTESKCSNTTHTLPWAERRSTTAGLPKAVCCEDFIHCCPQGKKCNLAAQTCDDASGSVPWLKKEPTRPIKGQKVPETKGSDVPCNDTVACLDGSTCCKTAQGDWACCPIPKAVCCEDFIHCCPQGKKCNLAAQTCDDASGSVPWLKKEPTRPIRGQKVPETKGSDVPCNDTVACLDGSTCCKTAQGDWACCPIPKAVCCEDFIHCCPQGTKCNLAAETCDDASGSVPWLKKEPTRPIRGQKVPETKGSDVPCNDTVACLDGTTCCKTAQGDWACCPIPKAVCCEDFIHCCPQGKKCNLAAQTCDDPLGSVPWLKKEPTRPIKGQKVPETKGSDVPCNDTVACLDGTTCCKTAQGDWACCPLPQAVCCEDFIHCCPQGTKCNLAAETCDDASGSVPWLKKEPTRPIRGQKVPETKGSDVPCNDTVACLDGTTCCKTAQGDWACCPIPKAVCCEDFIHCCPQGKKCNLAAQTCDDPLGSVPWLKKEPTRPIKGQKVPETKGSDVPCNDTVACLDGTTCCKTAQGDWACCPLPQAVCCEDFIHCCPQGTKCNLAAETCDDASGSVPWLKKEPTRPIRGQKVPETKGSDVPCNDTVACLDGTTCCKTAQGDWACCPIPKAVCCEDFIHCCPQGTKCNLAAETCDDTSGSVPWLKKEPTRPIRGQKVPETKGSDVPCNDTVACLDGTTCCKTAQGDWACCPLPQAVCCEDFIHCCPQGKKCNLAAQTCDDPLGSVPWLKKEPTRPIKGQKVPETKGSDVPCNDTVACLDGTTCCKTAQGDWACCPLPQAVCCEDFIHCCPQGTKCNLAAETCDDASGSVPWLKKEPTRPIRGQKVPETKGSDVPCNDTVACLDGTTCCKTAQGDWACCPIPKAVCCEDFIHCCPQGTKCNLAAETCDDTSGSVPWLKKEPTRPIRGQKVPETKGSDVPCNDTVACLDGTTCCKTAQGDWACCPLPQAVCCEDFIHCCPQGKKCNLAAQTCDDPLGSVPWLKKEPTRPIKGQKVPETKGSDVPCNDTVACLDGTTCCKTAQGDWACCPIPKAVCCEDFIHCCPQGTKCNLAAETCDDASGSVPWLKKEPTRPIKGQKVPETKGSDVPCNDTVACLDGTTCCKTAQGDWACCPIPKAVCCEDFIHCCPQGTKCNLAAETCDDASGSVPWLKKEPTRPIRGQKVPETKGSDVPCNDTVACLDGTTCCKTAQGDWACCPIPKAVCCEDFIHCCPQGTKCNLAAETCDDTSGSVPWLKKEPTRPIRGQKVPETKGSDVPCNDTVACLDGTTCCKTAQGDWACCPLPQAVCCEDFIHCCPQGKKCNLAAQTCDDPLGSVPWLKKEPTRPIKGQKVPETKGSDVPCNDTVACLDGTTCCKTAQGDWACCPLPQAVCCEDFIHCCPQGTKCNLAAETCDDASGSVPWLKKEPTRPIRGQKVPETKGSDVPCNDTVACLDGTTCCKTAQGDWACCPLPQAVCCEDFIHCCPQGKKCNLAAQTCDDPLGSVPWLKKEPTRPIKGQKVPETKGSDVPCNDTVACLDGTTCCKTAQGDWACCPLPQAVCCEDFIHCCPQGKKCNLAAQTCDDPLGSVPWLKKEPTRPIKGQKVPETKGSDVPCNDTVACLDGTTCCKTAQGDWACCPLPQAVCCEDFIHCCPQGKKCNLAAQTCDDPLGSVPWLKKEPTRPIKGQKVPETKGSDVPCNDTVACLDGTTCCKTAQGDWACCPIPKAVCCEDFIHCCPQGTKCNLAAETCDDPLGSVPWLKKEPTRPIKGQKVPETKGSDVPCNDTVACLDGTTCCKTAQGDWACCPLPQAVCCEDFIHCCPQGTKCNLAAETCDDASGSVPWLKKEPTRPIRGQKVPETKGSDVPCNDTVACLDGTTCCKTAQGDWACCPIPKAVCCEDFIHCCPQGTKCNLAAETCDDASGSVPWLKKEPTRPIRGQKVPETKGSDVPCNDTVACLDGTTCCKTAQGDWACCPLPQAVCCEDFIHCCPQGTKCNLAAETCDDASGSVPWLKKEPTRPIRGQKVPETKGSDVPCNDTVACLDGTTCCKTAQGDWACCPIPKAVCCEDFIHCCPQGTKCNLAAETCDDASGSVPWLKKEPTRPIRGQKVPETKGSDVPCNDTVACLDGTTCCKTAQGDWACCPLPQAVCCEDFIHCCPQGTKCNLAAETCDDASGSVPWLKKEPTRPIRGQKVPETKGSDVPCNDTVACLDGTTCCKTAQGDWACCPLPQAVCCEDFIHCCPQGKKCNLAAQTCDDPLGSVPWLKKESTHPRQDWKPLGKGHNSSGDIPCDSSHSCPDSTTCCKDVDANWKCCPFPQAICCSDGEHCCPPGYSCDVDSGSCVKTIWQETETVPLNYIHSLQNDIQCDDEFSCKDTETCCKASQTTWACCPVLKAVCCSDMEHCCPAGYTCVEGGQCAQTTDFSWDNWQVFFSKKKQVVVL